MNEIYKLEECPMAKQDLQKLVDSLDSECELCITCANLCMEVICGATGEETTIDNYCGEWKNGNL
jgi:hypothetical protein